MSLRYAHVLQIVVDCVSSYILVTYCLRVGMLGCLQSRAPEAGRQLAVATVAAYVDLARLLLAEYKPVGRRDMAEHMLVRCCDRYIAPSDCYLLEAVRKVMKLRSVASLVFSELWHCPRCYLVLCAPIAYSSY